MLKDIAEDATLDFADEEFVSTVLSQISWSNHLAIMSKAKIEE